jgi:septal ring factor EnvC (AmiA/AmiB activator)
MAKFIIELGNASDGRVYKNHHTVVYENASYYYCRVNGCDELLQISKDKTNKADSKYFCPEDEKTPEEMDKWVNRLKLEQHIKTAERKIDSIKSSIKWRENDIVANQRNIVSYQKQLVEEEETLNNLKLEYSKVINPKNIE